MDSNIIIINTSVFISSMWNSTVVIFFEIWNRWNPSNVPMATIKEKQVAAQIPERNLSLDVSFYKIFCWNTFNTML